MRPPQDLLYESESSLRLVDKAIEELADENGGALDVTGMLDGLTRAASLAEQLDSVAACSDENRREMAASLREELNTLTNRLHAVAGAAEETRKPS